MRRDESGGDGGRRPGGGARGGDGRRDSGAGAPADEGRRDPGGGAPGDEGRRDSGGDGSGESGGGIADRGAPPTPDPAEAEFGFETGPG